MLLLYRKSIYFFFLSISVIPTARSGEIAVESSLSSIEDASALAQGSLDNDNNAPSSSSSFTTTTTSSDVKVAQERFWRSQHQDQNHSTLSTPFVSLNKAPLREHFPPEDFVVNAHIVSGVDGLSYFAPPQQDHPISIPFQECSSVGITTPPIPLSHFNIRHLPPAGTNPAWQNTGPQPQLVVCLHPLQITVSSGEVRTFKAGDVVLLEDMEGRGHKMSTPGILEDGSTQQQEEENLSVLILTLPPPPKHHSQKKPTFDKNKPCKLDSELPYYYSFLSDNPVSDDDESGKKGMMRTPNSFLKEAISRIDMQRLILTSVGVASSSALSYFLAKVAPPLLAVVFGGGCVVVGGTCMVVKGGETIMDQLEERKKKKRMEKVLKILEKEEKEQFKNMFATQHQEESHNVVGSHNNSSEVTSSTSSSSSDGDTASKENNNDAVEFVASPHLEFTD